MKVLVLGASGAIGLPVAQAFVRAGYEVFGQTRNESKVKLLTSEEITPLVADPADAASWSDVLAKVDVVVECLSGNDIKNLSATVFAAVVAAAKKYRPAGVPRLTFIYCSGVWVHGSDLINTTSERSPVKNTTPLVTWRGHFEREILTEESLYGIIIRPALLYGRGGSLLGMMFSLAGEGKQIVWPARVGARYALIHPDDMADMFVRVAERAPICKGLVFDAANDFTESVDDILTKLVTVTGSAGWSFREPAHVFEEAMNTTVLLRPSLARSLVGWQPRKAGLVDGLQIYYDAWKATA